MASRTPEGKHVTRFIVLAKDAEYEDIEFIRSHDIPEAFATKGLALQAIDERGQNRSTIQYKVRQK